MLKEGFLFTFISAFMALFPVANPVGAGFLVNGLLSGLSDEDRRSIIHRIVTDYLLVGLGSLAVGHFVLSLFGLSLPVIQLGGGLLICRTALQWLGDSDSSVGRTQGKDVNPIHKSAIESQIFYPITFPISIGPGSVSVILTLMASVSMKDGWAKGLLSYAIIALVILLMCLILYLFLSQGERIIRKIGNSGSIVINTMVASLHLLRRRPDRRDGHRQTVPPACLTENPLLYGFANTYQRRRDFQRKRAADPPGKRADQKQPDRENLPGTHPRRPRSRSPGARRKGPVPDARPDRRALARLPLLQHHAGSADVGPFVYASGGGTRGRGYPARGFTTIRDAGGPVFGLKRAIDTGLLPGPRIYPSGAMISQTSGHGDFRMIYDHFHGGCGCEAAHIEQLGASRIVDGADAVTAATRENLRQGASQIKLMTGGGAASLYDPLDVTEFFEEEIRAAVRAAEDWGTYVMVHVYNPRGIARAIVAGVEASNTAT